MADVLLVFVREDRVFGDGLRQSLETSGLNVVRCENEFDHNNPAPCIVILWSAVSTRSSTLREIAAHAQRDGRLVSARIDNCDAPPALSRVPPFDLSQWSGDPDDPMIDPVFFAVDRLVMAKARRREAAPLPQAPPATAPYSQPGRPRIDSAPGSSPVTSNYAPIGRRQPDAAPVRAGPVGGRPPVTPQPTPPQGPPSLAEEALAWRGIEHSTDPTDYLNFLNDFGAHGTFAELAQFKLDKLTRAGKPAANGFIQHKPSPHVEPPKPRPVPPPVRPAAPPPELRQAPEPPWREPSPRERIEAAELEQTSRSRRSVSGRPRRRVAEAALEAPIRHEPRGGAPWAPILFVLLLAGGGFAYLQMQPKTAETASAANRSEAPADSERGVPPATETPSGDRTTLAAAYERAGPLAAAPAAPAPARAAPPREPQIAAATSAANNGAYSQPPENRAYSPTISYQPPAEATPPAPAFTAPPTVIATAPYTPPPAEPAPAPPPTPAPAAVPAPVETKYPVIRWEQQPTVQNRADAYPAAALSRGVSGEAMLDCEILASTRLNCAVVSESPANMGFGRAALQLAPRFKALPVAADGKPIIGKRVKIPVRFQSPGRRL